MAHNAEEVVIEWLNRQGFFTIRGARIGVREMDILALKFIDGKPPVLRHYEVQVSINPIGNLGKVPKNAQDDELAIGVREWIEKKYLDPKKRALRDKLANGKWSFHFVAHKVNNYKELELINKSGVSVVKFTDILNDLKNNKAGVFTAAGKSLVDLILID